MDEVGVTAEVGVEAGKPDDASAEASPEKNKRCEVKYAMVYLPPPSSYSWRATLKNGFVLILIVLTIFACADAGAGALSVGGACAHCREEGGGQDRSVLQDFSTHVQGTRRILGPAHFP